MFQFLFYFLCLLETKVFKCFKNEFLKDFSIKRFVQIPIEVFSYIELRGFQLTVFSCDFEKKNIFSKLI